MLGNKADADRTFPIPAAVIGMNGRENTMMVLRSQYRPGWSVCDTTTSHDVVYLIADGLERDRPVQKRTDQGEERGFSILYL